MRLIAASLALVALLLGGCGGGGGSSQPQPTPPVTPPVAKHSVEYVFFGQSDLAVTSKFTSSYHAVDWGAWSFPAQAIELRMIAEMQQARARGVNRFILSTGFLTFDAKCNWLGVDALLAFKHQLDALDLSRSVWMLYPLDEPDNRGCDDAALTSAYQQTQLAWGGGVRIGVIYGPNGKTPGINAATDVGRDDYGRGPQVVSVRSDQHLMLVAGGADPYKEDPKPYVDYAVVHDVSVVWVFLYTDYTDDKGRPQKGVANNGSLPAYEAAGCEATSKC